MLPLGYIELEYLQSTGTQWIDTSTLPGSTLSVEVRGAYIGDAVLFGSAARPGGTLDKTTILRVILANNIIYNQRANTSTDNTIASDTEWHVYKNTPNFRSIDSVTQTAYLPVLSASTVPIALFCQRDQNSSGQLITSFPSSAKISYYKAWDGETLVRSLTPAKRASDGVLGMYDTVSNQFFTNQGNGTFIAGPIKNIATVKEKVVAAVIPDEYEEVEYLQSSGTQYIDTGVVMNTQQTSFELKCLFGANAVGYSMFGVNDIYTITSRSNGKYAYRYAGFNIVESNASATVITIIKGTPSQLQFIQSDNTYTHNLTTTAYSNSVTSLMFGRKTRFGVVEEIAGTKYLYYCKIWDNGTLVRSFIPARRKSDSVLGMYDTVSGNFFTNQGTGTFTAGPTIHRAKECLVKSIVAPILPSSYKELEYIQTTGQCVIQTDFVPGDNERIKIGIKMLVPTGDTWFCGCYNGFMLGAFYGKAFRAYVNNLSNTSRDIFDVVLSYYYTSYTFSMFVDRGYGAYYGISPTTVPTSSLGMNALSLASSSSAPGLSNFCIFFYKDTPTNSEVAAAGSRFYGANILNSEGEIIRSYKPAKLNGTVGVYDIITNQFFTKTPSSTGNLLAGPEHTTYRQINNIKRVVVL